MERATEVTLVTVTYNSAIDLEQFWERPPHQGVEWIVVDNASTDDSSNIARGLGAKVIQLDTNVGFGGACNVGMRAASGPVIGFVNPDVRVIYEDLETLVRATGGGRYLVAPQLLNNDGTLQPNGRGVPSLPNKIINRLNADRAAKRGFRVYATPGTTVEVEWLTGAVILADRQVLLELSGFDETFFVYYEDVDLCLRAAALGVGSLVVGDATWTHGWARAAKGFNFRGWKLELASAAKFYRKYPHLMFIAKNEPKAEVAVVR
jgi:N-acetylglucosaminyl-diphospho-decaprenol L-rhamnosyltransferase